MFDKTIIKNISSLFSIQVASYIIPLLTLPYLVRTLGVESFGYLGFSLAIIQYCTLIINYGFNLSATSVISKIRDDKNKVSEIFSGVLIIRLLAFIFCALSVFFVLLIFNMSENVSEIILAAMGIPLGAALFPQFLFQGKEQLGLVSFARVLVQFSTIPLLFIFVNNSNDVWVAALISSLSSLAVAIYSLLLIYKRAWVVFTIPKIITLKKQLIDGWHIFISTVAISLYTSSVTVILGVLSGPVSVGYFVAADKIIKAVLGLYGVISNAFYPRVNSIVEKSKKNALKLIIKLGVLLISIAVFCNVAIFILADYAVILLFGPGYEITANLLKIFSVLPVVIALSNLLGIQILIPFGYKKEFSKVLLISGVISLLVLLPSVLFYAEYGAAISVLFIELLVTLLMAHQVIKLKIFKVKI